MMFVVYLIAMLVVLQEFHNQLCFARKRRPKPSDLEYPGDPRENFYTKMGWKKPINPWVEPYIMEEELRDMRYGDQVVIFIININNYLGSNREQTYITTGVFISSTRVVTSFNPFKRFLLDPDVVSKTLILSVHQFFHDKDYYPTYVAPRADSIQCGREIMPLPNDADVFYLDKEKMYSPLHDLMVFRVTQPKIFFPFKLEHSYFGFIENWHSWGDTIPGAMIASEPLQGIEYELYVMVGLGYINETEVKKFDKMHRLYILTSPADILDCDSWIPREWGYFICIRNFLEIPVVPSGSLLFDAYGRLHGVGSFMLTRNREEIFVFTDVIPYRNQLLHACTVYEFEDTPHKDMWW